MWNNIHIYQKVMSSQKKGKLKLLESWKAINPVGNEGWLTTGQNSIQLGEFKQNSDIWTKIKAMQ